MTMTDTRTPPVTGQCHPACLLLPAMTEEEYRELLEDIRVNGQRHPIVVDQHGVILDGRHRWRAVWHLGLEPKVETFHGTEAEKVALVIAENIKRRHLTTQQRAAIAAELATMKSGARTDLAPNGAAAIREHGVSDAQAAKVIGVSERSVERAKQRMRTDPEAHEKAKAGTLKRKPMPKPKTVDGDREPTKPKRSLLDALGAVGAFTPAAARRYVAEHPDEEGRIADAASVVATIAAAVSGKPITQVVEPVADLKRAWNEASVEERREFLNWTGTIVLNRNGGAAAWGPSMSYLIGSVPPPAPTLAPPAPTEELAEELAAEQVDPEDLLAPPELVSEQAGNGKNTPRMKTYTCMVEGCGTFEGPVQRGQPPKFCPIHRTSAAARKKAKEALREPAP
jgi:ParB-like chromosome segregation protein Spo0J